MNTVRALSAFILSATRHQTRPFAKYVPSQIRTYLTPCCDETTAQCATDPKPCLDIKNIDIVWGKPRHCDVIRSFLYNEFWPREPTIQSLWLNYNCSDYVDILTDKYCLSGDRFLAFEREKRTNESKLVGFCAGFKVYPWVANEYERWGHATDDPAARNRMFFKAHCIRSPNLFEKYNIGYYFEVEVLVTAKEVSGTGIGSKLLKAAIQHAVLMRYPRTVHVATGKYSQKVCRKCGMQKEWEMDYDECTDVRGKRVFCMRTPHTSCAVYSRENTCEHDLRTLYFDEDRIHVIHC